MLGGLLEPFHLIFGERLKANAGLQSEGYDARFQMVLWGRTTGTL